MSRRAEKLGGGGLRACGSNPSFFCGEIKREPARSPYSLYRGCAGFHLISHLPSTSACTRRPSSVCNFGPLPPLLTVQLAVRS
eukprot:3455503-Rhodomonas_salina.4